MILPRTIDSIAEEAERLGEEGFKEGYANHAFLGDVFEHTVYVLDPEKEEYNIGSSVDSDIHIDDKSVDENHSVISWNSNFWQVTDLSERGLKLDFRYTMKNYPTILPIGCCLTIDSKFYEFMDAADVYKGVTESR